MTVQVQGEFFIVPNGATTLAGMSPWGREMSQALKRCGFTPESDEKLIQVWYCSPECENWTSHQWKGMDKTKMGPFFGTNGLAWRLPASALRGVKEGDEISLRFTRGETTYDILLTARQEEYRYARFGRFEEVLEHLLSR